MKKMLIPILALSFSFAFEAGMKSVGGGVNFVRNSETLSYTIGDTDYESEVSATVFLIEPSGSYFVIDNLALGGSLMYTMESIEWVERENGEEVWSYSNSVDTDYEAPIGFSIHGAYFTGMAYGHAGYYEPDTTEDGDEYLGIGGGYLYQLADNVYIDTNVTYRHMLNGEDGVETESYGNGVELTTMTLYGTVGISVIF